MTARKLVNLGDLSDPSKDPSATAIIDLSKPPGAQRFSHGEIDAMAAAVARSLLARGFRRGERIAILSANCAEYLASYFGIMRSGLVAVPVSFRFPPQLIAYVLDDCGAKLAFCDRQNRDRLPAGLPAIAFDAAGPDAFADWLNHGPFEAATPAPREPAMFLYTSGSTGYPKGVVLSHQSHLWVTARRIEGVHFADHRVLVAAPLFHMNALSTSTATVAGHGLIVMLPQFTARSYIAAIAEHGCTWLTGVPTMIAMVLQEPDALRGADTARVKIVRMGSAPLSQGAAEAAAAAFPNAIIQNVYGSTEAGPIVFGPHPEKLPTPSGSVGYRHPETRLRLADGHDLDADEGVLQLRTPAMMNAYHNLPEKTADAFTPDGYYISGDLMRRDGDGFYYFVGRSDDMFVCGGENVFPLEVERLLERHPEVALACVVPFDDAIKGAKPFAFIVLRPGKHASADAIKSFALANAPAYQHPRDIAFVAAMPLTGTGKIDRQLLAWRAAELMRTAIPGDGA
jgi:long-chain acyl-CoA synthetase